MYIYGAGKRGRELLKVFPSVEAFIDAKFEEIGNIQGIPCVSLENAIQEGATKKLVIVSPYDNCEIIKMLKQNGFESILIMKDWKDDKYFFVEPEENLQNACYLHPFKAYDSPYVEMAEIYHKQKDLYNPQKEVLDIDFRTQNQLDIIREFSQIPAFEWTNQPTKEYRYHYDNSMFGVGSVSALYFMMMKYKPKRIIEIGSGFSTAAMLDVNEYCFDNSVQIECIEPYAARLKSRLKTQDKLTIHETFLQNIPLSFFDMLEAGDFLFIDSSHVIKPGSDVSYEIFEILPRLRKGVIIHFHDIMWPFEYPIQWLEQGRAYNEAYVLRALLMNNDCYSVQLFGSYLNNLYQDKIPTKLKGCGEGSIWIKKER